MKKILNSPQAPAPVGPYNHATAFGQLLFTSGQIALDPESGQMIQPDIEMETHQVMRNLGAILQSAGSSFHQVLKATVYVTDMGLYSRINAVYATYFDDATAPARELVQVAALPRGANVEISAIALCQA
jgi:2-iminobutanoate/2-iminopropanoate deaminase